MKIKLTLLPLLALFAANRLSAQCATNIGIGGPTTQHFGAIAGTLGTDITAKFWQTGTPANNSGTTLSGSIIALNGGKYFENTNWAQPSTGAGVCPPLAATTQTTTLVNVRLNEGVATHTGQYALSTVNYQTALSRFKSDNINNGATQPTAPVCLAATPNCVATPINIPVAQIQTVGGGSTYVHSTGTGAVRVTVNFGADAAGTGRFGYFAAVNNGTQPVAPLITGIQVYQINGAAPTTSNLASWGTALVPSGATTCTLGAAANCTGLFTVTTIPSSTSAFLAVRLMFDGSPTLGTDFVSGNSAPIGGPLVVDGLPTSVEAYNTKVGNLPGVQLRWTSTNESQIAGYNLLAARADSANFVQVNDRMIATGGAGTYTQNVTRRTLIGKVGGASSYLIKVQVVMRDGSTQDVGPATYVFRN